MWNSCVQKGIVPLTPQNPIFESYAAAASLIFPFFILLDAKIGGNAISNVYLQTITLVSLGYLKCKDDVSVQEMVNLYRYILPCREMVEETLGEKLDHDPMDMFNSEKRDLIECAIEVDKKKYM